jgi:hypothetical protein
MVRAGEALAAALLAHLVVGLVWFIFLGSTLVALENRTAFWLGVATWAALAPLAAYLAWRHRRWWRYGAEAAWLAVWAAVVALALAGIAFA